MACAQCIVHSYCSAYHHIWSSITLLHLAAILQRCFMEAKNAQVPLYKSTISENQVAPGDSGLFWGRHRSAVNTRASDLLCNKTLLCGWSGSKGFSVKNVGVYHVLCVRMMMRDWHRIWRSCIFKLHMITSIFLPGAGDLGKPHWENWIWLKLRHS